MIVFYLMFRDSIIYLAVHLLFIKLLPYARSELDSRDLGEDEDMVLDLKELMVD